MKAFVLPLFCIVVTGCASNVFPPTPEQIRQSAALQQSKAKLRDAAAAVYQSNPKKYQNACIEKYKSHMNDAASFEIASKWSERQDTEYTETIFYTVNIRGANLMGGKVLKGLMCVYKLQNGALNLTVAATTDAKLD